MTVFRESFLLQLAPRSSMLVKLVDSSPEVFEVVLQYLSVVEVGTLRAACRLLRRVTRDEALAAETQVPFLDSCLSFLDLRPGLCSAAAAAHHVGRHNIPSVYVLTILREPNKDVSQAEARSCCS